MENSTDLLKKHHHFKSKLEELEQLQEIIPNDKPNNVSADKAVDYETCEEKCEGMGSGPRIKTNLDNLLKERARLVSPSVSPGKLGDSKMSPADSCSMIISMYVDAIDGFYWIKNGCSKSAIKT